MTRTIHPFTIKFADYAFLGGFAEFFRAQQMRASEKVAKQIGLGLIWSIAAPTDRYRERFYRRTKKWETSHDNTKI